jgi:hypothetical protein
MADVTQDASGPASPRPVDTPQQASRRDSADGGKLRVFISYSRDDLEFADQLDAALNACGFECVIDRHGISGGEDWKLRLGNLISEADTVVFVLSPTSARSEICDWEVEEATRLGKRILPIICRPLEGASPPPRLRERNYIFFYDDPKAAPGSGFGTGLAKLVAALNTDFDWLREHTRYLQRATEWDRGGRPANRLLSGDDIAEAKAWAARRPKNAPEPTPLHLDFIRASEEEAEARSSAQRKQLEAVAAAQAEREKALRQAEEALKQAAAAQGKRARIRNIAFVLVGFFVATFVLLVAAFVSRYDAKREADRGAEELAIREAAGAGRHAEALQLREALAAKVEAAETRRAGKPGTATARALRDVVRLALVTREFTKALTTADRVHALLPDGIEFEINRAHALMFLGHEEESKALYLAHKDQPISGPDGQLWERVIVEDFAEFRKAGLTHPMMAEIEKELGVSP